MIKFKKIECANKKNNPTKIPNFNSHHIPLILTIYNSKWPSNNIATNWTTDSIVSFVCLLLKICTLSS